MEDFGVACPLVPSVPHLISGSCSSPRTFAPRFLQTPPHGDALALRLSFGSTSTWTGDSHPRALRHARHTRRRSPAAAPPQPFGSPQTANGRRSGAVAELGSVLAYIAKRLKLRNRYRLFAPQGMPQVPVLLQSKPKVCGHPEYPRQS